MATVYLENLPRYVRSGTLFRYLISRMAKVCALTGKRPLVGNNVSHSNRKTKRRQMPNLQKKTIVNPANGTTMIVMITSRAIRTLNKWMAAGKRIDLRKFLA